VEAGALLMRHTFGATRVVTAKIGSGEPLSTASVTVGDVLLGVLAAVLLVWMGAAVGRFRATDGMAPFPRPLRILVAVAIGAMGLTVTFYWVGARMGIDYGQSSLFGTNGLTAVLGFIFIGLLIGFSLLWKGILAGRKNGVMPDPKASRR
jgi:hypothetical protein